MTDCKFRRKIGTNVSINVLCNACAVLEWNVPETIGEEGKRIRAWIRSAHSNGAQYLSVLGSPVIQINGVAATSQKYACQMLTFVFNNKNGLPLKMLCTYCASLSSFTSETGDKIQDTRMMG